MEGKNNIEYRQKCLEELISEFEDELIRSSNRDVYRVILDLVERPLIEAVLKKTFGNKLKAAKLLGINRNTLHAKIKKLNIDVTRFKI